MKHLLTYCIYGILGDVDVLVCVDILLTLTTIYEVDVSFCLTDEVTEVLRD